MKICHLIYNYWLGPMGGTETQCRRLISELGNRDVTCCVVTARTDFALPSHEYDGLAEIHRLPTLGRWGGPWVNALLFQVFACWFLLKTGKKIDLIHVHTAEWIAGMAALMGSMIGIAVLCKPATIPVFSDSGSAVPFGKLWARLRRKCCFTAMNRQMRTELCAEGIPIPHVYDIPNSVVLPDLSLRCEEPETVLYVGNFSQGACKAFDVLFAAWCLVVKDFPAARLVVCGGGDYSTWDTFLEEQGCRQSVVFEGFVEDVDEYYRRAALFVLPSNQEGMSNALLESQSWGVPAVVTDIPGNRSTVENGINGIVVPVQAPTALAAGILRLLRDGVLRRQLGKAACRKVQEFFAVEKIAGSLEGVYQHLTSNDSD